MDVPQLIESIDNRIAAFHDGYTGQVLDRQALIEVSELLDQATGEGGRLPIAAAYAVARLRWCRFQALPEIEDQAELEAAMKLFMKLAAVDIDFVPEELRSPWPGGSIRPKRDRAFSQAVELLKSAFETGRDELLDEAIVALEDVARDLPVGAPDRPSALSNLGIALRARGQATGAMPDLDRAVEVLRKVTALTDAGDSGRLDVLESFALALHSRLERTNALDDLNEMIKVGRELMTGLDRSGLEEYISFFADALDARCEIMGSAADAREAINARRRIVELTPPTSESWPGKLSNLAVSFHTLFDRAGQISDLDMAIEIGRIAALTALPESTDRASILFNVSNGLYAMWRRVGDAEALTEAIHRRRDAVAAVDDRSPYRVRFLTGLGQALLSHFDSEQAAADVDEAVNLYRQAVGGTRAGRPERTTSLVGLREALRARSGFTGSRPDRDEIARLDELISPSGERGRATSQPRSEPLIPTERFAAQSSGAMVRGIVISGQINEPADGGYSFSGVNGGLRAVALYWDKAVWAYGNGMGYREEEGLKLVVGLDPAAAELEREGFLRLVRRDVYHPAWDPQAASVDHGRVLNVPLDEFVGLAGERIRRTALDLNESDAGEFWSVGRESTDATPIGAMGTTPSPALLLTIALPVPSDDVPMSRICEFRQQHVESITALRSAIEKTADLPDGGISAALGDLRLHLSEVSRLVSGTFPQTSTMPTHIVLGVHDTVPFADLSAESAVPDTQDRQFSIGDVVLLRTQVPSEALLPHRVVDFAYEFAAEHGPTGG